MPELRTVPCSTCRTHNGRKVILKPTASADDSSQRITGATLFSSCRGAIER
jgi:hypothetical protein